MWQLFNDSLAGPLRMIFRDNGVHLRKINFKSKNRSMVRTFETGMCRMVDRVF